jgi:hypothetical protein
MVDLNEWQKQQLATYKNRLARVQAGEVWGNDHLGPYTPDEKAAEIARIKSLIARIEKGDA